MRPRQMRPMWQSVYSHSRESDVICFFFFFSAPLCLTAARFFTPDPVVNSSERDR